MDGLMGTAAGRYALLLVMMTFFAMLALDITVPALVLSVMAMSNWLVQEGMPSSFGGSRTA